LSRRIEVKRPRELRRQSKEQSYTNEGRREGACAELAEVLGEPSIGGGGRLRLAGESLNATPFIGTMDPSQRRFALSCAACFMLIQIGAVIVTFVVTLIAIFVEQQNSTAKYALAGLTGATFLLAIFIEVQAAREAAFTKRALERLIQASTPSTLFAQAVSRLVIARANERGFSNCLLLRREKEDGYVNQFVFVDDAHQLAVGFFGFDHEQLAQWSLLDEKALRNAIAADMFQQGPLPSLDPLAHWDKLCDFLGTIGKGLYPDSVRNGTFALSARTDLVQIGLPYPVGAPVPPTGSAKEMLVGGETVPFLVFEKEQLTQLSGQSNLEASRTVAGWLAKAWGRPTILTPD
jgi:hypothetical protein